MTKPPHAHQAHPPPRLRCSSQQRIQPADPPTSLEQLFRDWGLDASLRRYHGRTLGIEHLYPWQARCLALPGVAAGDRDLLYSAPTSGGKTMVAELLLLLRVLGRPLACCTVEGEAAGAESRWGTPVQQRGGCLVRAMRGEVKVIIKRDGLEVRHRSSCRRSIRRLSLTGQVDYSGFRAITHGVSSMHDWWESHPDESVRLSDEPVWAPRA